MAEEELQNQKQTGEKAAKKEKTEEKLDKLKSREDSLRRKLKEVSQQRKITKLQADLDKYKAPAQIGLAAIDVFGRDIQGKNRKDAYDFFNRLLLSGDNR